MEWAARGIGGFYVVAGLIALRHALINWWLEQTTAAIAPPSTADRAADLILTVGALLVLASGMALLLLHPWAVIAFLTCWALQAAYLLWAQRWRRPLCPITARGRRETVNAFALYSVATLLVLGMPTAGLLN